MRTGILLFFVSALAASPALPQTPGSAGSKKTAAKKAAATTANKGAAASKTSVKTESASASRKGKSAKKPVVVAAYRQQTPTPDRYREIQQALVDKGYLKAEPNGVWDAQSSDALKQFQTDQKLTPTGKLSSASLIGLGLGPKTASSENIAVPPPNAAAPPRDAR